MKPAATSIVKFAYGALAIYLGVALVFYLLDDYMRMIMFLSGATAWIIVLLIWTKNERDGT